ncbi:MAG: retropepsin-like aspartic protease [Jaaginema sp. PMC 1079.18]|nr:retropepsin-like aspartic protease [Jaaginema sp. PMC 1080.18]MEC4850226.1 retropepsin-like aspartic protease [Jaaginema sp. PMC 1079.18]MEC4865889.1 retropepsin-like aspartic protease [Jaaginema sp. PMC 1078.18]
MQIWLRRIAVLLALGSVLSTNVACNSEDETIVEATTAIASPTPTATVSPIASPSPAPVAHTSGFDSYNEAINIASSAINYSKTALVREDWSMIARRWQQAAQTLQTVPSSHPQYAAAQAKIPQYMRFAKEAQAKAQPQQTASNQAGDVSPNFFIIPIKERITGIPLVEVKINNNRSFDMLFDTGASRTLLSGTVASTLNLKAVSKTQAGIADGSVVEFPVVQVNSLEVDGRIQRNFKAAVAPSMPVGLLGQDFYEGYDVTVKQNAIEFRKR